MRSTKGVARHRAWLGAAALGTLVFGLAMAGADVTKTSRTRPEGSERAVGASAESASSAASTAAKGTPSEVQGIVAGSTFEVAPDRAKAKKHVVAGQMPVGDFSLVARHVVDYRADEMTRERNEGKFAGSWPSPAMGAGTVAAGGCSFDVQCDDSNKCTIDTCNVPLGGVVGSGKCEHDPVPAGASLAVGGCDNGEYCDGDETCETLICRPPSANAGAACDENSDCLGGLCYGTCQNGPTATCCSVEDFFTLCQSGFGTCSPDSDNAIDAVTGKPTPCSQNSDCRGVGRCDRCYTKCTTAADCDDGRGCNGIETCDTGSGLCQRTPGPCGSGADCDEGRCLGGTNANRGCTTATACPNGVCGRKVCAANPAVACAVNADCGSDAPCVDMKGPVCYVGRCCGSDPDASGSCLKRPLSGHCDGGTNASASCKANGVCTGGPIPGTRCNVNVECGTGGSCTITCPGPNCDCPGGACVNTTGGTGLSPCASNLSWFAGDAGRESLVTPTSGESIPECGGSPQDLSEPYGCPHYSSGLTQRISSAPPVYPIVVGPISDSTVSVPLPPVSGGPGGPLNALGDDYNFVESEHIGLDVLRWVGGPITGVDRILIEFYDAAGNFIEDIVLPPQPTAEVGVVLVEFEPELLIPPSGWVVIRTASNFAPDTRLVWLSTTSANSTGTNNPDRLWVNNYSASNNNFLAPNPGILAFELVGDEELVAPLGACCDPTNAVCQDSVAPWVCTGRGTCLGGGSNGQPCVNAGDCPLGSCEHHNYNGHNSVCAACFGGTDSNEPCRRCVGGGNNGLACTGPASCPSGACVVNDSDCGGTTCFGQNVGANCTTDDDCTLQGSCPDTTCVAGDVGEPCVDDDDCDLPGTCDPAFCRASVICGSGACCNAGLCSVVPGSGSCLGGTFLGFGTDCDADDGTDGAKQHCCPQPDLAGLVCSGGPNNLDPCVNNAGCRFCVDSPNGGIGCTTNAQCAECVGGTSPPNTLCDEDSDCAGGGDCQGECLGTCGTRSTGADNAGDAYVHMISVPGQGQPAVTVTISGNNSGATSTVQNPDTCFGPILDANDEPGWFEAFQVNDCAWVRVDFCCTNPVHEPGYAFLALDPGCDLPTLGAAPNPYRIGDNLGEAANFRGEPYCKNGDDNLWLSFGPLIANQTYYYPIFSQLAGNHGDYQLHITVEYCPDAACCKGDGTCAIRNQPECDADQGLYLGRPQLASAQTECSALRCSGSSTPGEDGQTCAVLNAPCGVDGTCQLFTSGACTTGSCCVAPGACRDNDGQNHSMTEALCDIAPRPPGYPGVGGSFIGGVRCRGGSCPSQPSQSCNDVACSSPATTPPSCCSDPGDCVTDAERNQQRNPCPICEFNAPDNCQFPPGDFVRLADATSPPPTFLVDDFQPIQDTVLRTVCLLGGTYIGFDLGANCQDGPFVTATDFTVRLYNKAPGNAHVPGQLLGEWATDAVTDVENPYDFPPPIGPTGREWFDFSLTLLPAGGNPLVTVLAGTTYFIQIIPSTNGTVGGGDDCYLYLLDARGGEGNNIAYQDLCEAIEAEDANEIDLAYCLNVPFVPPVSPVAACCTGGSPACLPAQTFVQCQDISGRWRPDLNPDCSDGCAAEPNDFCEDALRVEEGFYTFDLFNALQDGPDVEACENPNGTNVDGDIWYFYTPSDAGEVYIGTCSCERSGDEVVAVYDDPNSTQCPCPGDIGFTSPLICRDGVFPNNHINPLGCVENFGDHGEVVLTNVTAGNCLTVRVAAFQGTAPIGDLLIALAPGKCGNNVLQPLAGEQCDGPTADDLCPNNCSVNCQCPPPVCGNSVHETPLGEECDATAPDSGAPCSPGQCNMNPAVQAVCTCIPDCGNDHREGAELCDGTDAGICGKKCVGGANNGLACFLPGDCASPGVCTSQCNNLTCRCPATCGNNVAEVGEACDGDDDLLCPTRCGAGGALPCQCPTPVCGNGFVEELGNHEECDGADTTGHGQCAEIDCRAPGDPGGECTCACPGGEPSQSVVWNPNDARTRSLKVSAPPIVTSSGASPQIAIRVTMTDLQTPVPANPPCCQPPNFGAFDTASNGTCTGATLLPNVNGKKCIVSNPDCLGGNGTMSTDDGACTSITTCSAAGETGGCARWVGKPLLFLESVDSPGRGSFKAARLQCSPFYHDFGTPTGLFEITGVDILPSSTYTLRTYSADCKGSEADCAFVSADTVVTTRRSGDVFPPFAPTGVQPEPNDVVAVINKFKNQSGAPLKGVAQIQPAVLDPHSDVGGLDIVATIDAFRGVAYPYAGPCACPSAVVCGATACSQTNPGPGQTPCPSGQVCLRTCVGGPRDGEVCTNNKACRTCVGGPYAGVPCDVTAITDPTGAVFCAGGTCPEVGVCPSGQPAVTGFCRDRCQRCR